MSEKKDSHAEKARGTTEAVPGRIYGSPVLTEFGSVSKLTTAKSGVSTDGQMQMTVCL